MTFFFNSEIFEIFGIFQQQYFMTVKETVTERLFHRRAHLAFVFRHTTNRYGLKLGLYCLYSAFYDRKL